MIHAVQVVELNVIQGAKINHFISEPTMVNRFEVKLDQVPLLYQMN